MVRRKYDYHFENGSWLVTNKSGRPIAHAHHAHKAVDIMASGFLGFSDIIPFYRKVWRLYEDWGTFKIYGK